MNNYIETIDTIGTCTQSQKNLLTRPKAVREACPGFGLELMCLTGGLLGGCLVW